MIISSCTIIFQPKIVHPTHLFHTAQLFDSEEYKCSCVKLWPYLLILPIVQLELNSDESQKKTLNGTNTTPTITEDSKFNGKQNNRLSCKISDFVG